MSKLGCARISKIFHNWIVLELSYFDSPVTSPRLILQDPPW